MKNSSLILLILISACGITKNHSPDESIKAFHPFVEFENFEIRQKPILNREYVLFLCWSLDLYGDYYSNKVIEILPENSLTFNPDLSNGIEPFFVSIHPNSLLKNYILNPKYLNYPLVGLSEYQIMEMESWLYDRYHETLLIKNEYLYFDENQKDEDSFNTESYLVGQYSGQENKINNLTWQEHNFKSAFRLPYPSELAKVPNQQFKNELIAYSFNSTDFLWLWNQHYISMNNQDTLWLDFNYAKIPISDFVKPEGILTNSYSNATLTNKDQEFINTEYLITDYSEGYPYLEKEFDGRMKFTIVGTDHKLRPIIASRPDSLNKTQMENKIFRLVTNKVIDQKYWP